MNAAQYDSEVRGTSAKSRKADPPSFCTKEARPMMSLEEASDTAAEKGSGEVMAHLLFEAYPRKGKRYPKLTYEDWLTLLGDQWTRCDRGIGLFQPELQEALPHRGPVRLMMTDEENAAYDALPEVVTIYRGCDAGSASLPGICWSLNKDVANRYPFLSRFQAKKPTVITACVPKHWILAVKLGRREEEIITFAAEVKMIRPADRDRADVYLAARTAGQKKMEQPSANSISDSSDATTPPVDPAAPPANTNTDSQEMQLESQINEVLKLFASATEANDPSAAASFYGESVDRYFLSRNITKSDVLQDKEASWAKGVRFTSYQIEQVKL